MQERQEDHERLHRDIMEQMNLGQWTTVTRTTVPREKVRTPEKKPTEPPKSWHRRLIEDE